VTRLPGPVLRVAHRLVHLARPLVEEAGAVRPGTHLAGTFGSFGAASLMNYPIGSLYGARAIHIGSGTLIGRSCSLIAGYSPDDPDVPDRALVIGDRCVIGAGAVFTAHESITIGDDVWFGNGVFISDASHGYQDPETPIGRQLGVHRPVVVGAGSWIGHGAVILPGSRIGRQVVVGAASVVRGDVPDHCVVAGVPARVVRRLEDGVGWVAAGDPSDVRPAWTSAEVEAMLRGETRAESADSSVS
jgi:acetyltransferase-like isoleucine patch superfamily enzyme